MESGSPSVGSPSGVHFPAEERMVKEDVVREMLARLARGEGVKRIARELGVDREDGESVAGSAAPGARGRRAGVAVGWTPSGPSSSGRAPEVDWNGVVLHRELQGLGFTGGYSAGAALPAAAPRRRQWAAVATTRFETAPGEQAQVDFGQLRLWVADVETVVHLFVFTLGYSRRLWVMPTRMNGWT